MKKGIIEFSEELLEEVLEGTSASNIVDKLEKYFNPVKDSHKKLRVLHYPQIPCKPFTVEVKDEEQAYLVSEALANQHLFLFENNFIPDYANIILVQMFDDGEWIDYYNYEHDMEFDEYAQNFLNLAEKE